jgi:myo-inositol 2-dehydrogenase / D-chiro-inositol 1-dehydrogenase
VRVAIVGTGGVARRHLGVLVPMADVTLVAHLSSDARRAEAQAAEWGGAAFFDIAPLLDTARPDAVWLCVTPDRHGPLEQALIERGTPFFVEKPLSVDVETAAAIDAALQRVALVTAVGYKFRALELLPRVRELLAETPPRMVLAAWHDAMPTPTWWRQTARSGGQVVEQATHLLDLARVLVGEGSVVSALAGRWPRDDVSDSDVADVTTAHLRFGDVPGILTSSCLLRGRQAIHLQLVCEGRVITVSEASVVVETGRERYESANTTDPFAVEDAAFLQAIEQSDPTRVLCSYADALESHRLACAIAYQAVQPPSTGSVVPVTMSARGDDRNTTASAMDSGVAS